MTPSSTHSYSASGNCRRTSPRCRIEWRPSRWLLSALALLALLAAASILVSEMPRAAAWPLAAAALAHGILAVGRERARPVRSFVLGAGESPVLVDGAPVTGFDLHWRGPLAFASWRDAGGRRQRAAWWPDTLPPAQRRELRLAAPPPPAARRRASMAP
ncbi:MAG TPA: hypothetical protein VK000_05110 [Luteimonas sp.]|nr:hypothetical protein [Luteimonas sp.]